MNVSNASRPAAAPAARRPARAPAPKRRAAPAAPGGKPGAPAPGSARGGKPGAPAAAANRSGRAPTNGAAPGGKPGAPLDGARRDALMKMVEGQQYALQLALLKTISNVEKSGSPTGSALPNFKTNVFTGFRQGGAGNCVTVAAIKAAMTRFGTGGVFQSVRFDPHGTANITMRDGYRMALSRGERQLAANYSRFSGADRRLVSYANFYYAAAAKRAQMSGNDGRRGMSFGGALHSLNNGEYTDEGLRWLGLGRHVRPISANWANVARYTAVVGSNNGHAMFVSRGFVERYGRASASRHGIYKTYALM